MEAIILAGGFGTRLGSRLKGIPKPMVRIGNQPFLEMLIERLNSSGCNRVILSVGHLHEVISSYFGSSYRGMAIDYSIEHEPLGTGGAIRKALDQAEEANVLGLNGDTILDVDYRALLAEHIGFQQQITLSIVEQENISRYGGVLTQGDCVVAFTEKGGSGRGWINGGVFAMNARISWPVGLPDRFSLETDFLMANLSSLKPRAFRCSGYFLDIGIPEDLDRAQHELAHK